MIHRESSRNNRNRSNLNQLVTQSDRNGSQRATLAVQMVDDRIHMLDLDSFLQSSSRGRDERLGMCANVARETIITGAEGANEHLVSARPWCRICHLWTGVQVSDARATAGLMGRKRWEI